MRAKQWRGALVVILMIVAVWLVTLIWGLVDKAQIAVSEVNQVKRQYQTLEERKATLEANVAGLESERGRDAAIRTAFGVALPGEEVIVVVPPSGGAASSPPSWWERLVNWFK